MLKNSRGVFFPRRSNFFSRFCINNPASVVPNFFLNHPPTLEAPGKKEAIRYCFFMCMHYAYIANFFPLSLLREKIFERKKVSTKNMLNCCKREREREFGNPFRFVSHIISYFLSYPIRKLSWKKRNVAAAFVYLKKQKKMLKNKFVSTKAWLAKFRKQN